LKFWIYVPSSIYATWKGLFTAIALGARLHLDPTKTRPGPNGSYIARMDVVSRTPHGKESITFKSNPKRSGLAAEENVATEHSKIISVIEQYLHWIIYSVM
jgi:hypothetical protein